MAGIVLWYLDGSLGTRIFKNVFNTYKEENNKFPSNTQAAAWLTKKGWPCKLATDSIRIPPITQRITHGLEFTDTEALTAFILRWGG